MARREGLVLFNLTSCLSGGTQGSHRRGSSTLKFLLQKPTVMATQTPIRNEGEDVAQ